jgi:hypothetical protein
MAMKSPRQSCDGAIKDPLEQLALLASDSGVIEGALRAHAARNQRHQARLLER